MYGSAPPQGFGSNNKTEIDEVLTKIIEIGKKQDHANDTLRKIAAIVLKINDGDQVNGEILTEIQQLLKDWINPDDENPNNIGS